eukprot:m.70476 g.70476  ORF g.70476 m.70476 type:complete len:481 (-) comp13777_c2_seq2:57-1499(-)
MSSLTVPVAVDSIRSPSPNPLSTSTSTSSLGDGHSLSSSPVDAEMERSLTPLDAHLEHKTATKPEKPEADLTSAFASVAIAPPDSIFALQAQFTEDTHKDVKMNLGIGAFRNDEGNPVVMDIVKEVEREIVDEVIAGNLFHEYPPIGGLPSVVRGALELVLGEQHAFIEDNKAQGVQAVSGTGALRLVAEFLAKHNSSKVAYISDPTWANHGPIFREAGFTAIKTYRYYRQETRDLNFDGLLEDLENANPRDVVILHACAHNPTGVDPSMQQWVEIAHVCKRKQLVVVFDCAYLGFASGDLDQDAQGMRYFANLGLEFFVCMSFSKNFGLYGERCGASLFISENELIATAVVSQLKQLSRPLWSVPPVFGGRIVSRVLGDPARRAQWKKELSDMASRILDLRVRLFEELSDRAPSHDWSHIKNQKGMFTFSGLRPKQCEDLKKEYHIYMLSSGRISVCGIPKTKVAMLAQAIAEVVARDG